MMKRILVLLLVLGMASGASAALDIYLTDTSGDSEIILDVDDVVTLYLWYVGTEGDDIAAFDTELDPGPPAGDGSLYGSILSGVITATGRNPGYDTVGPGLTDTTTGMELIGMSDGAALGEGLANPLATIDFQREEMGTVTITLIDNVTMDTGWAVVFPTMHGITINDIPEPMTMALLGLGGLLLRRRKKNSV